jgi:hypothetical protein
MRIAAIIAVASALALLTASLPAEAESGRARTRIIVKKPRSYLDAGTTVKPGTAKYHDYANPPETIYRTYGPFADEGSLGGARWPLPRAYELPGF